MAPKQRIADSCGAHVRLAPEDYQAVIEMARRERRSISAQLSYMVSQTIAAMAATKEG